MGIRVPREDDVRSLTDSRILCGGLCTATAPHACHSGTESRVSCIWMRAAASDLLAMRPRFPCLNAGTSTLGILLREQRSSVQMWSRNGRYSLREVRVAYPFAGIRLPRANKRRGSPGVPPLPLMESALFPFFVTSTPFLFGFHRIGRASHEAPSRLCIYPSPSRLLRVEPGFLPVLRRMC